MEEQSALLSRAKKGDAEAFIALVSPFSGMVYRHCLQMLKQPADAEDAAQEAMLRAYRAIPRFLGKSEVATWLYRIAHNTCLDMLKKPAHKRENASLEALRDTGFDPESPADTPENSVFKGMEGERLKAAIQKLPEDQQALLTLRYGENRSYEELAQITGLNEGTVKSKLSRAKAKLKELLEEP